MADHDEEWHREIAKQQFNRCWDLIELAERSPDDEVDMLLAAMTSRWHWGQVGGAEQIATGDWQVAHVTSLLGHGELVRTFAARNLAAAEMLGFTGWLLASAHEGMARACAVAGDADARARHLAAAEAALETEDDPESRRIVTEQLASVPPV